MTFHTRVEIELYLNQIAQHVVPFDEAVEWFANLSEEQQLSTLQCLNSFILQAYIGRIFAQEAVLTSGLKASFTPCGLLLKLCEEDSLTKGKRSAVLAKIVALPDHEHLKSFRLLVTQFSILDEHKKEKFGLEPDRLWWHQDLSDPEVIRKVLSES